MSNNETNVTSNVLEASGMSKKRKRKRSRNKNPTNPDNQGEISSESLPNGQVKQQKTASKDGKIIEGIPGVVGDIPVTQLSENPKLERDTRGQAYDGNKKGHFKKPTFESKKNKSFDNYKSKDNKTVKFFERTNDEDEDYHRPTNMSRSQRADKANELLEIRKTLPIYQHKDEILKYVAENQVVVIIGETGSGKSTQIPQFLISSNKGQIAVTQPRRVAASSLAQRVSEEYGCVLGEEVGYQVRFSNVSNNKLTKLKYLTDGMLLREIMLDNKLNKYSCIVIDEAHERTILTDMILGFLKQLINSGERPDLKVIVMSATLNAELFSQFFQAPILFIEGRTYPVAKYYLTDSSEDIVDTIVRAAVQINLSEQQGDILCFLPGQEEIDTAVNILSTIAPDLPKEAPIIVPLPLYAALSPSQQLKIFETLPKNRRKVILATNIAETSITVSGVRYVIDSGLRKVKVWKHELGLSSLLTTTISQASAKQRAGRAGREAPGKVFRLYLEKIYQSELPKDQESEIMRNDIVLPILTLKKIGVDDLIYWPWLEHPGETAILSALSTLYSLGALDNNGKITSLGYKMAVLPLPPQLSAVLITAMNSGVLKDVIDIVSCISVDNLVLNVTTGDGEMRDEINSKRRNYCPLGCRYGDLIAFKEYFQYFEELNSMGNTEELKSWCSELHFNFKGFKNVLRIRQQLKDYMFGTIRQDDSINRDEKDQQLNNLKSQLVPDYDDITIKKPLDIPNILKSFLKGYITNTAIGMPDRSYRTCTNGQLISIHPSSNLFGKSNLDAIMYIEYVFTSKGYARNVSAIELSWLQDVAPHILGGTKVTIKD